MVYTWWFKKRIKKAARRRPEKVRMKKAKV